MLIITNHLQSVDFSCFLPAQKLLQMEVLREWVGMQEKLDETGGDGNEICNDGWECLISVPVQVSTLNIIITSSIEHHISYMQLLAWAVLCWTSNCKIMTKVRCLVAFCCSDWLWKDTGLEKVFRHTTVLYLVTFVSEHSDNKYLCSLQMQKCLL